MKKRTLLLLLAVLLAGVSQTWAQFNKTFTATYTAGGPYTYDGNAKTGVSGVSANCNYKITGVDQATAAGNYTCVITSDCPGHYMSLGWPEQILWDHIGSVSIEWTINPRDLNDDVEITVNDQQWTGQELNVSDVYTIKYNNTDLTDDDYNVIVTKLETPTTIKDEGRYVIVFTGKGNFTGTVTKTFDVKKDLSQGEAVTGVHFDIPEQIYLNGQTGFQFVCEVTDNTSHAKLFKGEHYTTTFFDGDDEVEESAIKPGDADAKGKKYTVKFTGVAPNYDPAKTIEKTFYVVKEYQTCEQTDLPNLTMRITKAGYPVGEDSPTGEIVKGEMQVARDASDKAAIAETSTQCVVPAANEVAISTDDKLGYNVVGIQNNAFSGCKTLRWINSMIPGSAWTPASLDRTVVDTPFFGIPKMTLVYLFGVNVKGENYVYKVTDNDYRSELYHIYEDIVGDQSKYSDAPATNN